MSQGANSVSQEAGKATRVSKREERRRLHAEIDRKLRLLAVLGKKKLGEITEDEFKEYKRLAREVIDDMLRSMKP